jgi:hypothetical protein
MARSRLRRGGKIPQADGADAERFTALLASVQAALRGYSG